MTIQLAYNAAPLLSPLTGIGAYTLNLAQALQATGAVNPYYFYAKKWDAALRTDAAPYMSATKAAVRKWVPNAYFVARAIQQHRFGAGLKKSGRKIELYHEPNFLPFKIDAPIVTTIHDLSIIRYAHTHPADRVKAHSVLLPRAIENSTHLLAPTEFVRQEIIEVFGVSPNKVTTTWEAANDSFRPRSAEECAAVLRKFDLNYRQFILAVGTLEPRKNLILALNAFERLSPAQRARTPLVVVGMRGWLTSDIDAKMAALQAKGELRFLDYVDHASLNVLYSAAAVFVYPSIYEGFGLPPLEAMQSGTPVIISNQSCLPEVVGNAGQQVGAQDVDGLTQALRNWLEDDAACQAARQAGLQRAREFSWQRCAAETLAVYQQVLKS